MVVLVLVVVVAVMDSGVYGGDGCGFWFSLEGVE